MKACFFDVDGTLLPKYHRQILQETLEALVKLRENGHKVILCTGRGMEELDFTDFRFDGYILLNGQLCLDENMEPYYENSIKGENLTELIRLFQEKQVPIVLNERQRVYMNFHNDYVRNISEVISIAPHPVADYNGDEIYMATVYAQEKMQVGNLRADCWHGWAFDAYPDGGGKAKGMQEYCKKYRVNVDNTIAFGDAENDIELIRFAGIGIAMGNGYDTVKAVADYITDEDVNGGIEKALRKFNLI